MRLLVGCVNCERQFNAAKLKVGARFRCRCGTVLKVARPRDHKSRVIRCSSCGGPREKNRASCSHCGADFTLHERDLHTVCPKCLTRVSDRARYCHSCGTPICPEEEMGESTSYSCPACLDERRLHSRRLGKVAASALECDACAGLWLGVDAFEHLARKAEGAASISLKGPAASRRRAPEIPQPPNRSGYRPCPVCAKLMNRRNYGHRRRRGGSGAIIDYCRDHGVWFDSGELATILNWLRQGGQAQTLDPRRSRESAASSQPVGGRMTTSGSRRREAASGGSFFDVDVGDLLFPARGGLLGAMLGELFDG